ncbi:MAG: hypothetical protein KOO62_05315 [candidate division Zixibacteria bacterium]|nr:hypothetical protein [candidate division Zixibacteria bacterium]
MASYIVILFGIFALTYPLSAEQAAVDQDKPLTLTEEPDALSGTIIHADLLISNFEDHQAELYINDIPVARVGGKLQSWASVPVPEFLLDGTNTLSVVIGIGATPATAKAGPSDGKCNPQMEVLARIVRMKDGEMAEPGSGEMLAEIKWTGEKAEPMPTAVSAEVDLGKQFGAWAWQSADVLTLDSTTCESAAQFISGLSAAYTGGQADPIIKVAQPKHSEVGRAYPEFGDISFDDMFREQMEMTAEEPNWKPFVLPRDEYDLRLVADGRLIEAIAKNWRPIIRMEDGDYAYPMLIGKIKGEWQIMR